jgi:hypothetical protein
VADAVVYYSGSFSHYREEVNSGTVLVALYQPEFKETESSWAVQLHVSKQ